MNVLGLGRSDGKRKPRQIQDYTEDDLLDAFRSECSVLGKYSWELSIVMPSVLDILSVIFFKVCK